MVVGRQPFKVCFSAPVRIGTGSIAIHRVGDNTPLETIPVSSPAVSVGGAALMHGFEASAEEFASGFGAAKRSRDTTRAHSGKASLSVTTDAEWSQAQAFYSPMGPDWSTMDSVVFWAYTTVASAKVEPVTNSGVEFTWAVGRSAVGLTQNAWTRVSMPISGIATPNLVHTFGFNISTPGTYWFDDVSLVASGSDKLTFVPSTTFSKDNSFYVSIAPGAIEEQTSGDDFAGIQDATTWALRSNESPTGIQLTKSSVDENLPTGTIVGDFATTDPDGGTIFAYTLVSGTGSTDNNLFSIVGFSLNTAAILDYETRPSLSIRVRSTDTQGAWIESVLPIAVNNLPERTTWDVSTNPGIQAGGGNWGSDNFWTKNGTTLSSWPGGGNTAEFSGSNGNWTVNVNGTMQADSLVFTASGYTLNGGTLNLSGSAPTIVANADATVASNLAGGISKSGDGKLTISLSNSGMWSYTHKGGTTLVKNTGGLGTGNVIMENGGRILLGSGTVFSNPLTISSCDAGVGNGALMPDSGASAGWSGPLAVNANCAWDGTIAGAAGNSGTLTLSGALNMGGTATTIRHRSGTIVYKGGGGATNMELAEGTARLGATNGIPPNAVWTQPHESFTSTLDLDGYNQVFQAIHSSANGNVSIRNSGTQSTLGLTGNVDTTFAGSIVGKIAITKSGAGRQTLAGANTFQGSLSISGGTLRMGSAKALGDISGGTVVSGTGALDLNGQTVADTEPLSISGSGPGGDGALVNGATTPADFAGPLTLAGNATIAATAGPIRLTSQTAIGGNNNNLTLGGSAGACRLDAPVATQTGGLAKTGSGTWTLRGQSTFTGPTTIGSGTLCVAGSLSQSAVSVSSGAVLCGSGSIGGSITARGGAIAPGPIDSVGQLSAQSLDLSRDSGSSLRIQLGGTTKPGVRYDRLSLTGALVLGGKSILDLDLAGLSETGTAGGVAVAGSVSGQFATVRTRNNVHNLDVAVSYGSSQVDVIVSRKAPFFAKGASPTVREDAGPTTISGWATAISGGSGADGQRVGFSATNDHPSLFSAQPAISADGTLTFASQADSNGTATVRIRLGASDNPDSSEVDSFTISVRPVNDPPRFSKGTDPTAASDSLERIHAGWARSIEAGPADESLQKTAFRLTHTSPGLFAVQPSLSPEGTLRFTPLRGVTGNDTLYVRLGDDGGTSDGGIDSSAIDTFHIALRSLALELRPSTLKVLLGDTARFQAVLSRSDGSDSLLPGSVVDWGWTTDLGDLSSGKVLGMLAGTSRVFARFQGSVDSALLWVSELDTTLAPSTDSVMIRAGHGIRVSVPRHGTPLGVSVTVRDSSLSSRGIAGSDSAIVVSVEGPDTVRIRAPLTLVPDAKRRVGEIPSVYWMDTAGKVHLATSVAAGDFVVFPAWGIRSWWLGWDTVAPAVSAIHSTDSMGSVPVLIRWSASDNVAGLSRRLCLQKAGHAVSCRDLSGSITDTGLVLISRQDFPLGGRYWVEARDGRTVARTDTVDIVVHLDSLASPWKRTEDRYELLALPYLRGEGSAHASFRAQWGEDDPRHWRVFAADSGRLEDLLKGDSMDAWGRSFWVRTRGLPLTPWIARRWTLPMSRIVKIRLEPGWNAIGNPFGFDLSWKQIWRLAGSDSTSLSGPYLFDGPSQGWSIPDTTLRWGAWRGAAILNRSSKAMELQLSSVPDGPSGSGAWRARSLLSPPALRIGIQASQGGDGVSAIWAGLDKSSRSWELPPGPRSSLRASLHDPRTPATALLADIRVPSDSSTTWIVRLQGLTPRQPLILQSLRSGSDTLMEVWIHDDKSDRWLPLAETSEWAVGEEEERTFMILAGLPPGPRAPRPFSVGIRGAALAWSLPDRLGRCRVRIDAFDPRGRRLGNLVDEEMDPGSYGRPLRLSSPTGQVLLVLEAGGERISSRWLVRR